MSDAITNYIDSIQKDWQVEVCRQLDQTIRAASTDIEARIQYKKPHYLKNGKYMAVFGTAKGWVSLTIFNAIHLEPPPNLFEASDNGDRLTLKILEGQDVDYQQLHDLLQQASATIS